MNGYNAKFKADPVKFLETTAYTYPHQSGYTSEIDPFKTIKGEDVREFDLDPTDSKFPFVNLKVLGDEGAYAKTNRKGTPIVGHFLHWRGKTASAGPNSFGSLDLSRCTKDYIFTALFNGCHFVITRNNGVLRAYHEPTQKGVEIHYPDPVVLKLGPNADVGGGNGVIVRRPGGWRAIVSTMPMGAKTMQVVSQDFG